MRSLMPRTLRCLVAAGWTARSTEWPIPSFSPNAAHLAGALPARPALLAATVYPQRTSSTRWARFGGAELPGGDDSCLTIAASRGFHEIAFPAIATGAYGFPSKAAAPIAIAAVRSHLAKYRFPELTMFVCFDAATPDAYRDALG